MKRWCINCKHFRYDMDYYQECLKADELEDLPVEKDHDFIWQVVAGVDIECELWETREREEQEE